MLDFKLILWVNKCIDLDKVKTHKWHGYLQTEATTAFNVEKSTNHVLGLVESLGPSLTSLDTKTRASAIQLLADDIRNSKGLRRNDLEPLADFFCDRIKDHHSIVPHVLTAFSTLTGRSDLPDASAVSIVQSMFQHFKKVRALSHQHRATAFQTLVNLLHHKLEVLVMLRESFTLGYIQMTLQETHPRNHLTIFGLTRIVVNNFPIGDYLKELFWVTARGLPVDSSDLPMDSSDFPMYSTRIDCCKVYKAEHFRLFTYGLSKQLVWEAAGSIIRTQELALEAISAICSCLAQSIDGVTVYTDVDRFCTLIVKECIYQLRQFANRDEDKVRSSVRVLQTLLSTNQHAANLVLADVMPVILERLNTGQQTREKCIYLEMIRDLLSSSVGNVHAHKVSALDTVIEHTRHSEEAVRNSALRCLVELADAASS
ncbi:MMS19 [Bugula neritina]|uniref:MMS19 nucleotide excision repair protein n=1 Tax=Bugula neritina TaxID=10212 RepID=A0A7J7J315_BUGNE|nr:MMS19 [Bugula neritina]